MFNIASRWDEGGIDGANFRKAYEAESGPVPHWRDDDYLAFRKDPVAIELVKRMSVEGPPTERSNNEDWSVNVGIAWMPQDLIEYVVLKENDCGVEYVNLSKEKILDQLLEVNPNDSKQVERLQGIGKRILAHDIKYEYYNVE